MWQTIKVTRQNILTVNGGADVPPFASLGASLGASLS
jgi:hypothetical protein